MKDERLPLIESILNSMTEELVVATDQDHRDWLIEKVAWFNGYRKSILNDLMVREVMPNGSKLREAV